MASIRRLYEMARSRGEPTWAMLDWAAQQTGTFTIKDLHKAYVRAGGDIGETSFHTLVNKLIAKPWKDDQEKYALSDKRPIMAVRRGSRGAGGAAILKWGLDHPLREPPGDQGGESEDQEALGDAMDRLEGAIGREPLRMAIARWRQMGIHQAVADIRKSVPRRAQMDALHVASAELVSSGKATMDDVEDAENEIEYTQQQPAAKLPDAPGAASQRPGQPPAADRPAASAQKPSGVSVRKKAPEPPPPPEDEPEPDEDDPSHFGGGLTIPKQFFDEPKAAPAASEPKGEPEKPADPTKKKSPLTKFFKRK